MSKLLDMALKLLFLFHKELEATFQEVTKVLVLLTYLSQKKILVSRKLTGKFLKNYIYQLGYTLNSKLVLLFFVVLELYLAC